MPAPRHRNTALLLAARASGPAVTVVLLSVLARRDGAADVGLYGLAAAVFSLLEAAASLGMRHLLPRELAQRDDPVLRGSAAVICTIAGVVLAVLTATAALLAGGRTGTVLAMAAVATPLAAVAVVQEGYWLGRERLGRLSAALMAEQAIRLAAGLAALAIGLRVEALVALIFVGRAVAVLIARPPGGMALGSATKPMVRRLFRDVPVFVGLEAVFQLYWRVDVLLLSALASLEEVGFYVAAYRVFSALLLLPQSYGQVLLPALARERGGRTLRTGIVETLTMGAVLAAAAAAGSRPLMRFLYGDGFTRAAWVLSILAAGMVLASVDQAQGRALVARGRQSRDLAVLAVATLCNGACNVALIPRYGAIGAAIATLLALGVSVGGHAHALRRP